jgi:hypothetical protein
VPGAKFVRSNQAAVFEEAGAFRGIEAHGEGFQRARLRVVMAEEFAGPRGRERRHVVAPETVVARALDGVIFAGDIIDGEAAREGLHVLRTRLGAGVGLAGDALRFGAGDVFGAGEREEFAGLGGIDEHGGAEDEFAAGLGAAHEHGFDAVAGDLGGRRGVMEENLHASGGDVGREHFVEDREGDAGLVAEFGDGAVAGIEEGIRAGLFGERKVARVVIAHAAAESRVGLRAAEGFDLGVFVGRDGLRGELAADPVGLFGHDHAEAGARGGERGGDATGAAADDDEVGGEFAGRRFFGGRGTRGGAGGGAGERGRGERGGDEEAGLFEEGAADHERGGAR